MSVEPNGTATLSVNASWTLEETPSFEYSWYYYDAEGSRVIVDDEDVSTSLTVESITRSGYYYCIVTDNYGNEATVTFYVKINTGLDFANGTVVDGKDDEDHGIFEECVDQERQDLHDQADHLADHIRAEGDLLLLE